MPLFTEIAVFGKRQDFANNFINALLALPPSGISVTATLRIAPPASSETTGPMRLADAFGVSRTFKETPSRAVVKSSPSTKSVDAPEDQPSREY